MNKLVVKLPLILGVIGAIAFVATSSSWAATKKHKRVAASPEASAPAPAESAPGSEMLQPPMRVDPIFPYAEQPPTVRQ